MKFMLLLLLLFVNFNIYAQDTTHRYQAKVELRTGLTTNHTVPLWLRANQFGAIPPDGLSGSLISGIQKNYKNKTVENFWEDSEKKFDWKVNAEIMANAAKKSSLLILQANAALKYKVFELKVGRTKDVMGFNGDSTLSSGNFAISGNALGVPKVEISIPEYWKLPFFSGLLSIKGNFSHGWIGKIPILESVGGDGLVENSYFILNTNPNTFLHQKSFYARLGKATWKLKLYGGFSHQVFWGNEREAYGDRFDLPNYKAFLYVVSGQAYGKAGIPTSKIGNQIGSIDLGIEYDFEKVNLKAYRQNFYDVGALYYLANIRDGLNGITLTNKRTNSVTRNFQWKAILLEFLYSKDQAGYPWSKPTPSGDEDYYNNYYYKQGWSYKGEGLGNPLFTPSHYAKPGQVNDPFDYFISNRLIAWHAGAKLTYKNWDVTTKFSYSINYGTFATSPYGKSTGSSFGSSYGLFKRVEQTSFYLEGSKNLKNNLNVGAALAFDSGKLLNNSQGFYVKVIKNFSL